MWRCVLTLLLVSPNGSQARSWKSEIQALLERITSKTTYGISIGIHDATGSFGATSGPRTPVGLEPIAKPGNLTVDDTYVMGSGTKPFTATAVMRLVDQGKVSLSDTAANHIDKPMRRMWNTTFVGLFGAMAANVTVGHLIHMQSGLGDSENQKADARMLNSTLYDPIVDLEDVANYTGKFGCRGTSAETACTWVCAPGKCTSYSSVNYLLAGLVLIAHTPNHQNNTWQTYDMASMLGQDYSKSMYPHTSFPTIGSLAKDGLTTAGDSERFSPEGKSQHIQVHAQDASVMGWCYGNAVSTPVDVARFYFELLGPGHKFLSAEGRAEMQRWHCLDRGWSAGTLPYGAGLEMRNVKAVHQNPPDVSDVATFVGHDGVTFGFFSNQGWFPALNTSIVVMTNQDHDQTVNYAVTCRIVKVLVRRRGLNATDINCPRGPTVTEQPSIYV